MAAWGSLEACSVLALTGFLAVGFFAACFLVAGAGAHAGAKTLARKCQEMIDGLEVDMATIDELQEIHDRK